MAAAGRIDFAGVLGLVHVGRYSDVELRHFCRPYNIDRKTRRVDSLEQALIEANGGVASLLNKINSISPSNQSYKEAIAWAQSNPYLKDFTKAARSVIDAICRD